MVESQFGAILKEFETFFNCPLKPDDNHSCLIKMGIGIALQVELNRDGMILIGCRLGTLPMGRYRDLIIREALKSNDATSLASGILGFSQKLNQLVLFTRLDPNLLSPDYMLALLPPFVTKAKLWVDTIAKGELPASSAASSRLPSGIFGLIS